MCEAPGRPARGSRGRPPGGTDDDLSRGPGTVSVAVDVDESAAVLECSGQLPGDPGFPAPGLGDQKDHQGMRHRPGVAPAVGERRWHPTFRQRDGMTCVGRSSQNT